ncbi:hypothetical protein NQ317_000832 [Molorchus minor]|uniref:THAP-type domain-containing protein n=1 Tax=Molorchus minor TaxID=1323400 RepID=A0ABQ9J979_9CUCU|nr:hypothetical protein NQ317_000832 [Molorchus minor]
MENKWCFVPGCKNTSKNAPKKLFVTVPRQMPRKIKWFKAARRDLPKTKAIFFAKRIILTCQASSPKHNRRNTGRKYPNSHKKWEY